MSATSSLGSEVLRYAPLFLTVVGWWWVNRQNNKRESRKEHRALVDAAKRQVVDVATKAVAYLQDSQSSLAPEIKWALDALEVELVRIPGFGSTKSQLLADFVAFTDACTGGMFEEADRKVVKLDSDEVQSVIRRRNGLLSGLEAWFITCYP